ncbi:MAG: DNA polymerase III, delta prime subunit [Parcubacteria bacterium 34_609]|nr:MAG: DNA polymerase III, delta prime subunit [Parcubacteria bacterium 34_609]KUK98899.1 MAG: DNA polymerase III, delta prime subunit [Parcubacteria bacterium 32_520]
MIVGNEKKIDMLRQIIKNDNIPHAMIFSGPEMIGKKKIAIEFIKNIFCEDLCGECYFCKSIECNPDINIITPVDGNIEIEEIRKAKERLSLKPYHNKIKALIIDDSHLMKSDAQNAFLKMLEEPKGDTLIIFITPFREMLLKTIRSRAQEIKFSLVSNEEIEKYLISLGASSKKAKEISLISSGQIGKAINFFEDKSKMDFFNKSIEDIIFLSRSSISQRFQYAEKLKDDKIKIIEILDIWERFLRREILLKVFNYKSSVNYSLKKTKELIDELEKIKYIIESSNVNKRMAFESLLIKL